MFGRIYDQDGNPIGTDFLVNSTTANHQHYPTVGVWDDGSFVVAFYSLEGDNNVRARLFSASGVPLIGPNGGNDFLLSGSTSGDQLYPELAVHENGFVAVWLDSGYVRLRRFDRNGSALGSEITVTDPQVNPFYWPKVTMLPDGGFFVVWDTNNGTGDAADVWGQRFDAAGARVGTAFRINTTASGYQRDVSVASDADGSVLVTWSGAGPGDTPDGIFAQRFHLNYSDAGGIHNAVGGTVNLKNTIVADNASAHNVPDVVGVFNSQQGNLIGDGEGASGLTNGLNSDKVGVGSALIDPEAGIAARQRRDNEDPFARCRQPGDRRGCGQRRTHDRSTWRRPARRRRQQRHGHNRHRRSRCVYASISGRKFHDARVTDAFGNITRDYNGIQDADEEGLADWTMYLDINQNNQLDDGEPTAITARTATTHSHNCCRACRTPWPK